MEIERKFIVHNLPDNLDSYPHSEIEQGYLCMEPVIRIRRMNKQYFLTFKSKGLMARTEHEFPLDKAAYEHLLPKVDGILISKTRYKIPDEHGFIIELDVFHGEYEGLVMAEVEFPSEEVAVEYEVCALKRLRICTSRRKCPWKSKENLSSTTYLIIWILIHTLRSNRAIFAWNL